MSNYILSLVFLVGFFTNLLAQTLSANEVFNKVVNSVVKVYSIEFEREAYSQGSGVVLDSNIIVTNYHVFDGCKSLMIEHFDKKFDDIKILFADPEQDILILFVNNINLKPIKIADSLGIVIGDKIFAIGSPEGFENTITEGIISGIRENKTVIQISAGITHGSSGGAVVNEKGELVGISQRIFAKTNINLNFAIPVYLINKSMWCNISDKSCLDSIYSYCQSYNLISYIERLFNIYYYNDKVYMAINKLIEPLKNVKTRIKARELIYNILKRYPIKRLRVDQMKRLVDYMGEGYNDLLDGIEKIELNLNFYGGYEKIIDAIRKEPDNGSYYYILGKYYGWQGNLDLSIKNLFKAYYLGDEDAIKWLDDRSYIPERNFRD